MIQQTFAVVLGIALTGSFSSGANASIIIGDIIGIDFGGTAPIVGSTFNHYSDVTIANGATEAFIAVGSLTCEKLHYLPVNRQLPADYHGKHPAFRQS